jgi:hypothetical protein
VAAHDANLETIGAEPSLERGKHLLREHTQSVDRDDAPQVPQKEETRPSVSRHSVTLGAPSVAERIGNGRAEVLAVDRAAPPQPCGVVSGECSARGAFVQQPNGEIRLVAEDGLDAHEAA